MGIVVEEGDVLEGEGVQFAYLGVEGEAGEGAKLALELFTGLVEVVFVEVKIAEGVDKFAGLEIADLGDHGGEQRVGSYVEGNAEEKVGAALVELATESAVEDEELEESVAGRESHAVDLSRVPSGDEVPATVGIFADAFNEAGDLID